MRSKRNLGPRAWGAGRHSGRSCRPELGPLEGRFPPDLFGLVGGLFAVLGMPQDGRGSSEAEVASGAETVHPAAQVLVTVSATAVGSASISHEGPEEVLLRAQPSPAPTPVAPPASPSASASFGPSKSGDGHLSLGGQAAMQAQPRGLSTAPIPGVGGSRGGSVPGPAGPQGGVAMKPAAGPSDTSASAPPIIIPASPPAPVPVSSNSAGHAGATSGGGAVAGAAASTSVVDLDTVYLGFDPGLPGSSSELDISLPNHALRFTAWTSTPADHFQDFNININVSTASTWQRVTTATSDRLVFTFNDPAQNIRLAGNFTLTPYWRGSLDTSPIDPSLPMDNTGSSTAFRWPMVRAPLVSDPAAPTGSRAMPFGVFNSMTPSVSIPLSLYASSGLQVQLDDGFDQTSDAVDVTSDFVPRGLEAVADNLPFGLGTNRLTFSTPQGSFEVFSLHYNPDTLATFAQTAVNDDSDFMTTSLSGTPIPAQINAVGVDVPPGQPEVVTSSFFRVNRMRAFAYVPDFPYYAALVHGVNLSRADAAGDTTLYDFLEGAAGQDPREALLTPQYVYHTDAFSSEGVQAAIAQVLPAAPARPLGFVRANNAFSADSVQLAQEHFSMDTFPGERLAARAAGANNPVVAIVDTGFGKQGTALDGDLPLGAFRDVWQISGPNLRGPTLTNSNRPDHVVREGMYLGDRRNIVGNDIVQDPLTQDEQEPLGHGTSVAEFVAGRGAVNKLGTGPDARITILRMQGLANLHMTAAAERVAAAVAIQDPQVRVVNFSLGGPALGPQNPKNLRVAIKEVFEGEERVTDLLSRNGVITVMSAGNNMEGHFQTVPSALAPRRGQRGLATDTAGTGGGAYDDSSTLAVRVAASTLPANPAAIEGTANFSGTGDNVSATAPGFAVAGVSPDRNLIPSINGTSFSAPMVSGLIAEVLRVLELQDPAGAVPDPPNVATRMDAAHRLDDRRAIEIVEATADRLGRDLVTGAFSARFPADDNNQGYGRINVWNALLSAFNRGVAAENPLTTAADPDPAVDVAHEFDDLPAALRLDAAHTAAYGFRVRFVSGNSDAAGLFTNATAWINNNPYDDVLATPATLAARVGDTMANTQFNGVDGGAGTGFVTAYKREPNLNVRTVSGGPSNQANLVEEMDFTADRGDLTRAAPPALRRLEIRPQTRPGGGAADATDQPFFSIPLDLARLRTNNTIAGGGNGTDVRFKDFVFDIVVDHSVAITDGNPDNLLREVVLNNDKGALPANQEQKLTVFVRDRNNAPVRNTPVTFTIVDTNGAADNANRVKLRLANGVGAQQTTLPNVMTDAFGGATVWVTRTAPTVDPPDALGAHLKIDVPITSTGQDTTGAEFPEEFTLPIRS